MNKLLITFHRSLLLLDVTFVFGVGLQKSSNRMGGREVPKPNKMKLLKRDGWYLGTAVGRL